MKAKFFAGFFVLLVLLAGCTQQQVPPANSNQATSPSAIAPGETKKIPPQTAVLGAIEITLTDPSGNTVENGVVEIFLGNQKIAGAQTNAAGKATASNLPAGEIYVTAADAKQAFQAVSAETEIKANETAALSLQLKPPLQNPDQNKTPATTDLLIESDDAGFYKDKARVSSVIIPAGSNVKLTMAVQSANTAFGGLDFKSTAFATFNVPAGQQKSISFAANDTVTIDSYWPSSSVHKATLTVNPQ